MNGTKHRIGASSDGKFGLNEAQLDQLDMLKDDKEFSQRDYFTKISRNPLLTIYFVELKTRKEGETNEDILNMVKRYEENLWLDLELVFLNYQTRKQSMQGIC